MANEMPDVKGKEPQQVDGAADGNAGARNKDSEKRALDPAREEGAGTADNRGKTSVWHWTRVVLLMAGALAVLVGLHHIRRPFLDNPIIGEEGYFAFLAVDNGSVKLTGKEGYLCHVRVGNRLEMDPSFHPVPPYLFIVKVLRKLPGAESFSKLTFDEQTRIARIRFFYCFYLGIGLLLAAAVWAMWRRKFGVGAAALFLIAFTGTTPLMVTESIKPQIDGSLGVMLAGLVCFFLFAWGRFEGLTPRLLFAFFAGFFGGMGKNEWAMALGAAVVAGLLVYLPLRIWFRRSGESERIVRVVGGALCVLLGLGIASLISYKLDPVNYRSGIHLMSQFENQSKVNGVRWPDSFEKRLPLIWPILILASVAGAMALGNLRRLVLRHFGFFLIFLWGMALLAGFLLSTWQGGGVRYFSVPGFVLLFFCVAAMSVIRVPSALWREHLALCILGISLNCFALYRSHIRGISITEHAGTSIEEHVTRLNNQYQQYLRDKEPVIADQSFCYYYPDADFISNATTEERQQEVLRAFREGRDSE